MGQAGDNENETLRGAELRASNRFNREDNPAGADPSLAATARQARMLGRRGPLTIHGLPVSKGALAVVSVVVPFARLTQPTPLSSCPCLCSSSFPCLCS
jgi:hypothetical protein